MRKRVMLAAVACALTLTPVAPAQGPPTNEEIDRNDDGIICINDRRGGFGTTLTDNNSRASATGCPANHVPSPVVPG